MRPCIGSGWWKPEEPQGSGKVVKTGENREVGPRINGEEDESQEKGGSGD